MGEFPYTLEEMEQQGDTVNYRVQPIGYTLTEGYKDLLPKLYSLEVRPDDVWLLGLPKSGTTWATELIWTVYHEANVKDAKEQAYGQRWCIPENDAFLHKLKKANKLPESLPGLKVDSVRKTAETPSPRFIRTHLPLSLLPPNLLDTCKVVYIARDFKDCLVSMVHMFAGGDRALPNAFGTVLKRFTTEQMLLCPWTSVLKEAWEQRCHKNMKFILYEDLKKDLGKAINEMGDFLGKNLSEEQIETIKKHLSFESMKENSTVNMSQVEKTGIMAAGNNFIRKGIVGDWKNHFTPELLKEYNDWWQKNMEDCDFKFPEE